MNFDTLLSIGSFAVAVGALYLALPPKEPLPVAPKQRRNVALAVIVVVLCCLTALLTVRSVKHELDINRMEAAIVVKLSHHEWTMDQLIAELHYPDQALFREAFSKTLTDKKIDNRPDQITISSEQSPVAVQLYHVTEP